MERNVGGAAIVTGPLDQSDGTLSSSYNIVDMDDDSDDGPFERCPECDRPVVSLARHHCPEGRDPNPVTAKRRQSASDDDRDTERLVILPSGKGNTTYHEVGFADTDGGDGDGEVPPVETACWHDIDTDAATIRPQRLAADRGYAPCEDCRRTESDEDT